MDHSPNNRGSSQGAGGGNVSGGGSRSVPEWRGKTPDSMPPTSVRIRIFDRYGGRCYRTGVKLQPGQWQLDHIKPLHLGGANAESNLAPICTEAHREKSAAEVTAKAKADRIRAKHIGAYPKTKTPLRSRGFQKTRPVPKEAAE